MQHSTPFLSVSLGFLLLLPAVAHAGKKAPNAKQSATTKVCKDAKKGPLFPFPAFMEETRFETECGKKLFSKPRMVWGYMTQSGCVAIEPQFGRAEPFSADGLAVVGVETVFEEEARWGIGFNYGAINRSGELVIEPKYLALSEFKSGVATGMVSEKRPDFAFPSKVGYFVSASGEHLGDADCGVQAGYPNLSKCRDLNDGLAFERPQLTKDEWKEILPSEEVEKAAAEFSKFMAIKADTVFSSGEMPGRYVDVSGAVAIEQWFLDGCSFSEGLACARSLETKKVGYIDRTGKVVIPFQYTSAGAFNGGLASVFVDGKAQMINTKGAVVMEPEYRVSGDFHEGLARVMGKVDKKWRYGFMDQTGALAIPIRLEGAGDFGDGLVAVEADNLYNRRMWRFIDAKGQPVEGWGDRHFGALSTPRFQGGLALVNEISLSDDGTRWVMENGKMTEVPGRVVEKTGYINLDGEWVFGPLEVSWGTFGGMFYNGKSFCEQKK